MRYDDPLGTDFQGFVDKTRVIIMYPDNRCNARGIRGSDTLGAALESVSIVFGV